METAAKEWTGIRPIDGFGEEIRRGSVITYPMRRGSSTYMVDAVVVSAEDWTVPLLVRPIRERFNSRVRPRDPRRLVHINPKNVWITLLPHLKAVKLSEKWEIISQ